MYVGSIVVLNFVKKCEINEKGNITEFYTPFFRWGGAQVSYQLIQVYTYPAPSSWDKVVHLLCVPEVGQVLNLRHQKQWRESKLSYSQAMYVCP